MQGSQSDADNVRTPCCVLQSVEAVEQDMAWRSPLPKPFEVLHANLLEDTVVQIGSFFSLFTNPDVDWEHVVEAEVVTLRCRLCSGKKVKSVVT